MVSAKNYLKMITIFITLMYLVITSINYIIDPYWKFDFAPSNTIVGVNNQISEYSMAHVYPELMLQRQKRMLQKSLADTVVIGSSRSLRGLNTCGDQNIQKVGFFGISQYLTMQLFETTMSSSSKKNIFIELGSLLNNNELPSTRLTSFEALFSTRILFNSLSNFYESYSTQQKYPLCNISTGQRREWRSDKIEMQQTIYQNSSSLIEPIMERIALLCKGSQRNKNNPLNIILYIDPVNPNLVSYDKLVAIKQTLEDIIIKHNFGEQCSLKTEIFQESKEINQQENWFDFNHYKPALGTLFLEKMINRQLDTNKKLQ
ncbi:hypothetical protein [Pseudoalteromonas rhizosphaerae]|uniref:hypothetical protein n=1 Tax=Pseudoalteromonas rhizosphaerae TaxID=2518973 RepID=UPI0021498FAB|nr:hypothetical protein [Pseudoalteromonas rhizosphaerae]